MRFLFHRSVARPSTARKLLSEIRYGVDSRIAGKPGGATSMNLFSTKNHSTRSYVRNADMWLNDIKDQLTCAAAWKQVSSENLGGVLITPWHVLYCRHSYPDAFNPGGGREIGFVLADGTYVYGIQVSQAQLVETYADMCVATMDRNMQELGVHVVPIWGGLTSVQMSAMTSELPLLAISQGGEDTGAGHDVMCYIQNQFNYGGLSSPRNLFDYFVYENDSGTPKFVLHKDIIYLFGIIILSNWFSVPVYDYITGINNAIATSDALAVTNGDIDAPTGATVTLTAPGETLPAPSGGASLSLSGVDISGTETGFRDEKSTVSATGPWTTLGVRGGALSGRGTSYAVTYTGQNYNTRTWVRTLATNASGDSAAYPPSEIVTRPNELPSAFAAAADGPYAIELSWVEPTSPPVAGGYRIEVYNGSAYELLDSVPTGSTSYTHIGLGASTTKQYRLTCFNSNSDGSKSTMPTYATASATTAASPYVVEGDFDTGLAERGIADYWSTTGVVTPNYPQAAIWSGTSILVANSASISRAFTAVDNLSVFFGMKCSAEYFQLLNMSGVRILLTGGGGIYFGSPSTEYLHFAELTNGLFYYPGEPVCYVWIDYVKAQGATPGSISILVSPTPAKPTPTAANFASYSHASFSDQISSITLKGPTQFDHVRASTAAIGSYPV